MSFSLGIYCDRLEREMLVFKMESSSLSLPSSSSSATQHRRGYQQQKRVKEEKEEEKDHHSSLAILQSFNTNTNSIPSSSPFSSSSSLIQPTTVTSFATSSSANTSSPANCNTNLIVTSNNCDNNTNLINIISSNIGKDVKSINIGRKDINSGHHHQSGHNNNNSKNNDNNIVNIGTSGTGGVINLSAYPSTSSSSLQPTSLTNIIDINFKDANNIINNIISKMHHHKSSSSASGGQQQLYATSSSPAFPGVTTQRVIHTNNGLTHAQAGTMIQLSQRQGNNGNHLVPTSIFNHQQSNAAVQLFQLPMNIIQQTQPIKVQGSSSSSSSSRNQANQQMTVQIQQLQQINNGTGQTITLSSIGGSGHHQSASAATAGLILDATGQSVQMVKKPKKKYPKKKPEPAAAYNPYSDTTSDYSPHCPKAWNRKVTGQVFCRGCGKGYLKYSNGLYEKGYYVHCIKECKDYRDLDMVKSCDVCRHLFINKKSFSQHPCEKAKKKELKSLVG